MTDPVKLSRERWEMLVRSRVCAATTDMVLDPGEWMPIRVGPNAEEIDGITFLPATYVPSDDGSHVEYHFGNGSSIAVG